MSDQRLQWPIERRTMPVHLEAEAAANPGGWVYEIEVSHVDAEAVLTQGAGAQSLAEVGRAVGQHGLLSPRPTWAGEREGQCP